MLNFKTKHISSILFFVVFVVLSSCKTNKNITETFDNIEVDADLQNADEVRFKYFYVEGIKNYMLKNYSKAHEMLEFCLDIKPKSAATLFHLSKVFYENKDFSNAVLFAQSAIKYNSANVWYKMHLVNVYLEVEKYDEAAELLQILIKQNPQNEEIYFTLTRLYYYTEDYTGALSTLNRLEKQSGYSNEIGDFKIKIYNKTLDYDKVIEELEILIEQNPGNISYHGLLAEYYFQKGYFDRAQKLYETLETIAPNDPRSLISAAFFYFDTQQYEKAYSVQTKAFANKNADVNSKLRLFYKNRQLENEKVYTEQAILDLLDILSNTHPKNAAIREIRLQYLLKNEDKEESRQQILEIIDKDKSNFELWKQLLLIDSQLNDYQSIISHAEQALVYYPNQSIIYYFLGFAYAKTKQYEEAIQQLEISLQYLIDDPKFEQDIQLLLAESYFKNQQTEESFKIFDKILKVNPANTLALNNYSFYLSLEKKNLDKAVKMAKLANELVINNANFLDTYAWALFQSKHYLEALRVIEKAIKKGGNKSPTITEHYGDILSVLKQRDRALEQWKQSKKLGNNSKLLQQKIDEQKYIEKKQ